MASRDDQTRVAATDRRSPECVARWPECESGAYDPRCCRFPKSCSCERAPDAATRLDYGLGHGFVVFVRHEDDEGRGDGRIYGTFEERRAAERKAAAINKRLEAAGAEVAMAYVIPLGWASTTADRITEEALGG